MPIFSNRSYEVTLERDWIDVTSEFPSYNESWTFTDAAGHEHRYERGFPTLRHVIDAEHWCNGNEGWMHHDPHMHVDAAHFECVQCGETISPAMDPPFTPKKIPGLLSGQVSGMRSDGVKITAILSGDEFELFTGGELPADSVVRDLLDRMPEERITLRQYSSQFSR